MAAPSLCVSLLLGTSVARDSRVTHADLAADAQVLVVRLSPCKIAGGPCSVDWSDRFVDDLHRMTPVFTDGMDERLFLHPWLMDVDFEAASKQEPSYGWSRLGTLMNPLMHAIASKARGGPLHAADAAIWKRIRRMVPYRCPTMANDPCGCYIVGCVRDAWGDLRLSALVFGSPPRMRKREETSESVAHEALKDLSGLPELRALHVTAVGGRHWPVVPQLQSLSVYNLRLGVLTWASKHPELISLIAAGGALAEDPDHIAAELRQLCKLRKLRQLRLPRTSRPDLIRTEVVPDCWSPELTILDLRAQGLSRPPQQLNLPELRSFVAFGQCLDPPSSIPLEERRACEPMFETRIGEDDSFKCPCMRCQLEDFAKLQWPRLERLWLDANYIVGTIPARLLDRFPRLVSLDLHDNALTGSIPDNFGKRRFEKLQVHANRLSGTVPAGLWRSPRLEQFSVFMNQNLSGCAPRRLLGPLREEGWHGGQLPGTQIGICEELPPAGVRHEL